MKLLLLTRNQSSVYVIRGSLKKDNFLLDIVDELPKALCLLESRDYDLVLIHFSEDFLDLYQTVLAVHEIVRDLPMMLLVEKGTAELRVDGLLAGFDDVVTKEISLIELSARIRSLIRRCSLHTNGSLLSYEDLKMDTVYRSVTRAGKTIYLRRKEYDLLEYMLHHPEQVLSRQRLLDHIWPEETFLFTNTVDVHMSSIRKKIDSRSDNKLIHTIHGIGYKISKNK